MQLLKRAPARRFVTLEFCQKAWELGDLTYPVPWKTSEGEVIILPFAMASRIATTAYFSSAYMELPDYTAWAVATLATQREHFGAIHHHAKERGRQVDYRLLPPAGSDYDWPDFEEAP